MATKGYVRTFQSPDGDYIYPQTVTEAITAIDGTTLKDELSSAEHTANKTTTITAESTDIQYPSAKSVYSAIPKNISSLTNDSGYVTTAYHDATKVDAVEGKQLSTNDYDTAAKTKVDAIPENPKYTDTIYDDTAVVGRIAAIEGQESTWNAKQNALPTAVKDRYLHANASSGSLEWSELKLEDNILHYIGEVDTYDNLPSDAAAGDTYLVTDTNTVYCRIGESELYTLPESALDMTINYGGSSYTNIYSGYTVIVGGNSISTMPVDGSGKTFIENIIKIGTISSFTKDSIIMTNGDVFTTDDFNNHYVAIVTSNQVLLLKSDTAISFNYESSSQMGVSSQYSLVSYVGDIQSTFTYDIGTMQWIPVNDFKLPDTVNDRFLHTNSSTGVLEWAEASTITFNEEGEVGITTKINADTLDGYDSTYFEAQENRVTSITEESTDLQYPSAKAVYTALQSAGKVISVNGKVGEVVLSASDIGAEDLVNKVVIITKNSTDDEYPTAKAVYNLILDSSEYLSYGASNLIYGGE